MRLESNEAVFARLNELGFDRVQAMRDRGEHLGDDRQVREWLEIRGLERLADGHELQKRAVAAAERAAASAEVSARWTMIAAAAALLTVVTSLLHDLLTR